MNSMVRAARTAFLQGCVAFWRAFDTGSKVAIVLVAVWFATFLAAVLSKDFRELNITPSVLRSVGLIRRGVLGVLATAIGMLATAAEYALTHWFQTAVLILLCVITLQLNSLRKRNNRNPRLGNDT
jgi:hypothetical protein